MSVFGNNEELIAKIKTQFGLIKSKGLSAEEFENLLNDTRELYERVLILRYKSFEQRVGKPTVSEDTKPESNKVVEEVTVEIEKTIEVIEEKVEDEESEESFAFSLFGEIEDDQQVTEETKNETAVTESIQPETIIGAQHIPSTSKEATSLLERLSEQNNANRLSDKLKLTRIESLSSVFTLNDRIRFSQGLFKGNNDAFQVALTTIESFNEKEEAFSQLKKYSEEYGWDMESKDVEHFYEFITRLYV